MDKAKLSQGNARKAVDGRLDTNIKIKKKIDPWFSARVPKSTKPHVVEVYNVDGKASKQRKLQGFEVYQGKSAGKLDVRCSYSGIPYDDVTSVGPFTSKCPGNNKKRFITVIVPGEKRTLNIAEVIVYRSE